MNYIKTQLDNWDRLEVAWLIVATGVILSLSLWWGDNATGIIMALSGVLCVVLTGKGKSSAFIFGLVQVVLYAIVSYEQKFYGEVMLNVFYYVPMSLIGFLLWQKNIDKATSEVIKKRLPIKHTAFVFLLTLIGIVAYGFFLKSLEGGQPFVDSASTVVAIVAQYLSVKRYMEQWFMWIAVNVLNISMWGVNFFTTGESISVLLMWSIFLINAIIMMIKWNKEAKSV